MATAMAMAMATLTGIAPATAQAALLPLCPYPTAPPSFPAAATAADQKPISASRPHQTLANFVYVASCRALPSFPFY